MYVLCTWLDGWLNRMMEIKINFASKRFFVGQIERRNSMRNLVFYIIHITVNGKSDEITSRK